MRFELARMFLLPRSQVDAFERRNPDGSLMSRNQWLRAVFSEEIRFLHRQAERLYLPDAQQTSDERIIARIGSQNLVQEANPDDNLRDFKRPSWRACLVIIDPRSHEDGQKVAIQERSGFGSGFGNFQSLAGHINGRTPQEPYAIELHSITDPKSFWDYVRENKGKVTSITLDVAVPNMFGGSSSYEEDMKRLKEHEKARRVKEQISNPDGLNVETERMRDAVGYASRGGGRIRAHAKGAPVYDSTKDKRRLDIDVDPTSSDINKKAGTALDAFDEEAVQARSHLADGNE